MSSYNLQTQIINILKTLPDINAHQEILSRTSFIKTYMQATGLKKLVLGLSGGVDSTTTGLLAQQAVSQLRDECKNDDYEFIAMRLPYAVQADESDAQLALNIIKPDRAIEVNIQPMLDGLNESCHTWISHAEVSNYKLDFSRGNNKARARMMAQFYVANLYDGLVLGTDHSAEAVSGFFTKFGDGACDLAPLFGLNKRQVRTLASALGAPESLVHKTPTADLEDNNPQLPDEEALGVTYDQIDDYLEGKTVPKHIAQIIENRYQATEHKRRGPATVYDDWYKQMLPNATAN